MSLKSHLDSVSKSLDIPLNKYENVFCEEVLTQALKIRRL